MSPLYQRAFTNYLFSLEMLCAAMMFFRAYALRKRWPAALAAGVVALGAASFALRWSEDRLVSLFRAASGITAYLRVYAINLTSNLLLAGMAGLIMAGVYRTSRKNILFLAIAASTIRVSARSVFLFVAILRGWSTASMWDRLFVYRGGLALYLALYAAVYALVYFAFIRRFTEPDEDMIPGRVLIPVCMTAVYGFLFANVGTPRSDAEVYQYCFLLLAEILICALGLTLQFSVLNWYQARLEKFAMEQIYRGSQKQFALSNELMDAINLNAHDLKHKVGAIIRAVEGQGSEALRRELMGITDAIGEWDSIYQTGSRPLDTVLTEKAQICRQRGIELTVMADGTPLERMNIFDLYSLFSNALDNAIEAVCQIPEAEKRLIMLSVTAQSGFLVIQVDNSYRDRPTLVQGRLVTRKSDKRRHGFGVQSMKNTVEKYGGQLTIEVTDELFRLNMILPVPEEAQDAGGAEKSGDTP